MELTSADDIERVARESMALTDWCAVSLGSPLRVHAYSYGNWGIVMTPENVDWLFEKSREAYGEEWTNTSHEMNVLIADASKKAGLSDTNKKLNKRLGIYAADYIKALMRNRRSIHVLDIGAGPGGTTLSVLEQLVKNNLGDRLSSMQFTLLDPSISRLGVAFNRISEWLSRNGLPKPQFSLDQGGTERLELFPTACADIVVSTAAIHHESFNTHLNELLRVLKNGSPFASADWHEPTYESPARVYWMYNLLQNLDDGKRATDIFDFVRGTPSCNPNPERPELRDFRKLFGLDDTSIATAFDGLSTKERLACIGGMKCWLEIAKAFSANGQRSPEVLLRAHERVAKRTEALKNAGFVFDADSRKKYCEVLKKRGFGELATVMVPKKKALTCQAA